MSEPRPIGYYSERITRRLLAQRTGALKQRLARWAGDMAYLLMPIWSVLLSIATWAVLIVLGLWYWASQRRVEGRA